MTDLAGASEKANSDSLDNEIKELEKALHNYEQSWSVLLEAMKSGDFEKDEILDRQNNIKPLRRLENLQPQHTGNKRIGSRRFGDEVLGALIM